MSDTMTERERRERVARWLPRMKDFACGKVDGAEGAPWAFVKDCADLLAALDAERAAHAETRADLEMTRDALEDYCERYVRRGRELDEALSKLEAVVVSLNAEAIDASIAHQRKHEELFTELRRALAEVERLQQQADTSLWCRCDDCARLGVWSIMLPYDRCPVCAAREERDMARQDVVALYEDLALLDDDDFIDRIDAYRAELEPTYSAATTPSTKAKSP